jgi:mannose 2-epimerase
VLSKATLQSIKNEVSAHLETELLPFWLDRCKDHQNGGFITHFDQYGRDTGEDQKSLIAQTRTIYTMSSAHRAGYGGGACAEYASFGVDFLIDRMWDKEYGGFYWTVDRKGRVQIDKKIAYGLSFCIYSLAEYTLATGDQRGLEYAEKVFTLLQNYAVDLMYGGYFEMFERNWDLCAPEAGGGDRKTLDVHMHLMEAFTTLFECSKNSLHRRRLTELIEVLLMRILNPQTKTGIPQFWRNWQVAPQIKFDIVWGWDRFSENGMKKNAGDNTSYGHNVEFAWLLLHALKILGEDWHSFTEILHKQFDHCLNYGIDWKYGGVFVEGSHSGQVYDFEKEFWQQAEVLIGMLDACLIFDCDAYWPAFENVQRFVFDKMINHEVGEWWPLLTREGTPIWTHMSHSWKVNYHTVRSMIQSIQRLEKLIQKVPELTG